jgi:hypothetical protein
MGGASQQENLELLKDTPVKSYDHVFSFIRPSPDPFQIRIAAMLDSAEKFHFLLTYWA